MALTGPLMDENRSETSVLDRKFPPENRTWQGMSIHNLIDEDSIVRKESTWTKLWGGFITFETASAGLIGLYFCVRMTKLIIDMVIHGYALHSIYGWSIHLLGALWDSVTNLLLHVGKGPPGILPSKPPTPEVPERSLPAMEESLTDPPKTENLIYPPLPKERTEPTAPQPPVTQPNIPIQTNKPDSLDYYKV